MEIIKTKIISETQFEQISQMWNEEFPVVLKDRFSKLLENVENYHHYFIEKENQILAWAADFEKDGELRFSIIVREDQQGKGFGTLLLNRLKRDLGEFYGWVIDQEEYITQNGTLYKSPLVFYRKNGFEVLDEIRSGSELIKAVKIKNPVKIYAETERFILREILPSDSAGMFELDSDEEVHQYLGKNPVSTLQQSIDVIHHIRQQYLDHGIGRWAIIDKKTNDFIGWTGLKFITDNYNNHQNCYDLGYRLIKRYWGQGIATETAIASLKYAFEKLDVAEIFAMTESENQSSQRILQKVGLRYVETFDHDGIQHNWFEISRKDYQNRKLL